MKSKKKPPKKPTKFNKGDLVVIEGDLCSGGLYDPEVHKKDMVFVVYYVYHTKGPFLGNEIVTYTIYPYRCEGNLRWRNIIEDIPESILRKPTKQEKFIYLMDRELLKKNEEL